VAALDCRGQGGQSEDRGGTLGNTHRGHIIRGLDDALGGRPQKLLFRQIFLDTAQLAQIVMDMPEVDPARVGAAGGSQGGALTLITSGLDPRVTLAAPNVAAMCDHSGMAFDRAVRATAERIHIEAAAVAGDRPGACADVCVRAVRRDKPDAVRVKTQVIVAP